MNYKQHRNGLLMLIVSLSCLLAFSYTLADDSTTGVCPLGQNYWKNTPTWPVTQLTLGNQVYTQVEMLILLNSPVEADASLLLAHQLIAAKLNSSRGLNTTVVNGVIAEADAFLASFTGRLPYNLLPSDAAGQTLINLSAILESYNQGQLTLGCLIPSTPSPTPATTLTAMPTITAQSTVQPTVSLTPTIAAQPTMPVIVVIEGPVNAININIITIYNINIQLSPDDPNLSLIQIGDIVRVHGTPQSGTLTGSITIVAISVVIINVEVNNDTGDVWRDDSDCSNPPPDWAPAHGWRRRCENNPQSGKPDKENRHSQDDDDD